MTDQIQRKHPRHGQTHTHSNVATPTWASPRTIRRGASYRSTGSNTSRRRKLKVEIQPPPGSKVWHDHYPPRPIPSYPWSSATKQSQNTRDASLTATSVEEVVSLRLIRQVTYGQRHDLTIESVHDYEFHLREWKQSDHLRADPDFPIWLDTEFSLLHTLFVFFVGALACDRILYKIPFRGLWKYCGFTSNEGVLNG
jgi:hypothetical protein